MTAARCACARPAWRSGPARAVHCRLAKALNGLPPRGVDLRRQIDGRVRSSFAGALILVALVQPQFSFAQSQTSFPQLDQRASREPFGAASLSEDHGPLVHISQTIRELLVA